MIAGHVVIGDYVAMMGGAAVHHFVTIGEFAYIGGYCRIHHDVPPFVKVDGSDQIRGLNKVGLARAGTSAEEIKAAGRRLPQAVRRRKRPLAVAMKELESLNGELTPHVREVLDFLRRRNEGRNGRYLEGKRSGLAAAIAEVVPPVAPEAVRAGRGRRWRRPPPLSPSPDTSTPTITAMATATGRATTPTVPITRPAPPPASGCRSAKSPPSFYHKFATSVVRPRG